jgi:hypothetical protein
VLEIDDGSARGARRSHQGCADGHDAVIGQQPKEEPMADLARTPVAADRQHAALQTIFSFFRGLMVLAFIGVGWVIFSGNSVARFAVMAFALVVAISLGYAKFVRGRTRAALPAPLAQVAQDAVGGPSLAGLEARVAALEARAAAAAVALGGPTGHEKT